VSKHFNPEPRNRIPSTYNQKIKKRKFEFPSAIEMLSYIMIAICVISLIGLIIINIPARGY